MINIGMWNELTVLRQKDFGIYLGEKEAERASLWNGMGDTSSVFKETEVLLPAKQVPEGTKPGDTLRVFVYRDSSDRIIATVNEPYITLGELKVLKCVGETKIGAFMDWGLEKDILLPFKEQTTKVTQGRSYLVKMYKDRSDRLCVSMKVYDSLEIAADLNAGDEVTGTVIEFNPKMGAFVAVENKYYGLIPLKEIHSRINVGDTVSGRVAKVREDGKLDITISKNIKLQINEDSDMVYDIIKSYNGVLPFNDKAPKETIEREFGLSKNAFKRAVGHLLKEGLIEITDKSIIIK